MQIDVLKVQMQVAKLGMQICVAFPVVAFALTYILYKALYGDIVSNPDSHSFFSYLFIFLGLMDLTVAYLLKRREIKPERLRQRGISPPAGFGNMLKSAYVVIFAVGAFPVIYGIIYYFLTADIDTFVLLTVMSPAGYLIVKPRASEIEHLAEELYLTTETEDDDIRL